MGNVRERDVDFVGAFEGREDPIDHIHEYTLTQNQLSTNMYNRLISCTTGTAFQIVESVPHFNGIEAWRLLNFQYDPKTDARLTALVLSIIGHNIKGKDIQAGLLLWEAQLLSLERDHQEQFSPKIKRALLMNVLPTSVQTRIMEHLDRLKTYKEVREKIVTLCHNVDDADIGNVDANDAPQDQWEGWWQDDNFGWREPEAPPAEDPDIQGLADMRCHVSGGLGHMARHCATPNPKGGGKGGKAGPGKGGKAGVKRSPKCLGKEVRNSHLWCTTCNKVGRLQDRCCVTFPDLQRKKKVQGVDGGEEEGGLIQGFQIAAIDTCACNTFEHVPLSNNQHQDHFEDLPPSWSTIVKRSFTQTTAARSGELNLTARSSGDVPIPRLSN